MWDQTFHAARVRMTVGGRGRTSGSGGTALDLLSCAGLYSDTERPHTMFRLLNIFLASSVLGRTGELAIMVSRLCGKVCAPSAQALAAEVGLDFVYREVDGCSLRIFEEVSAFAQEMGGGSLGLGGAVGLAPVLEQFWRSPPVEAETGFRLTQPGGTRSLSLLDRGGLCIVAGCERR
ncbi:hypothetical protein EVAR_22432_1 [Eumeta japonica]|uniref:Uncharacterized protein n=1 Tax=Eumeta variegata TaxID=151549 RepID=A0A4C1ZWV9_EUMVA|nr:hypothetical protein EVAR_22432_1 [Eumeta japonica]